MRPRNPTLSFGVTLRDLFAAFVLSGTDAATAHIPSAAKRAYELADAMLAERTNEATQAQD